VAIDIETGDFEVSDDSLVASDRLLERNPDAQTWFILIGHCGVHRLGWHGLMVKEQSFGSSDKENFAPSVFNRPVGK
jgi:hypothetical protein